jgi:hypothetical protein
VTRVVTLTGTVDCGGTYPFGAFDGFPDITSVLRQVRLGLVARGTGGTWPARGCAHAAPWQMTVRSETGHPFKRGWASIVLRGYECNLWECVTQKRKVRVHLHWG